MADIIPFPEPAPLTFPTPEHSEPIPPSEVEAFYHDMFQDEYLECTFVDLLASAMTERRPYGYMFLSTEKVSKDLAYYDTGAAIPEADFLAIAHNEDGSQVKIAGYSGVDVNPGKGIWPNKVFESDNILIHTLASKILSRFTYATVSNVNPLTIRFGGTSNSYITLEAIDPKA